MNSGIRDLFFDIVLEDDSIYRMQIGFNFHKYKIVKGNLYRGFQKLGKIKRVKEVDW